jgi:hypothetical protein
MVVAFVGKRIVPFLLDICRFYMDGKGRIVGRGTVV